MLAKYLCVAAVFFVVAASAANAQNIQSNTHWKNQRGSELNIATINADGSFSGTFVNNATGFDCKGTPYLLSGWIDHDEKISFSVRWNNATKDCHSIASWVGYYRNGKLITLWYLVYDDAKSKKTVILHGADTFSE